MQKFNDLPEMKAPLSIEKNLHKAGIYDGPLMRGGLGEGAIGSHPMRCGGCGSKVLIDIVDAKETPLLLF